MKIPHDEALKAADYAVKLHCTKKYYHDPKEADHVNTLLSLGAFRAIEYLNMADSDTREDSVWVK